MILLDINLLGKKIAPSLELYNSVRIKLEFCINHKLRYLSKIDNVKKLDLCIKVQLQTVIIIIIHYV